MLDVTAGTISFEVEGGRARELFKNEAGGHRFQRVPPNERNGRVHTSTITVSVLDIPDEREFIIQQADLRIEAIRGSGNGGQKKNKTSSCIVATHIPTQLTVRVETERSQHQNKALAIGILEGRIRQQFGKDSASIRQSARREQIGSGMRGDKRRTARIQHNVVVDHVTGQQWTWDRYASGRWE